MVCTSFELLDELSDFIRLLIAKFPTCARHAKVYIKMCREPGILPKAMACLPAP